MSRAKPGAKRRARLIASAALLSASLAVPQAHAYVRSTTKNLVATAWNEANINLLLYVGNPPEFLDRATIVKAVHAAAATWSKPAVACTDLVLNVTEVEEPSVVATIDRVNRIGFRHGEWRKMPCDATKELCAPYQTAAIAITTVTSGTKTGEILDADMEINAVNKKFADVVTAGDTQLGNDLHDLQNTMTHEFGHLIGLDHTCWNVLAPDKPIPKNNLGAEAPSCGGTITAEIKAATMYAQAVSREIEKRTLEADDLQAVCEVYPVGYIGPRTMADENSAAGCAVGGKRGSSDGRAPFFVSLALVGLGLAQRFRRRRGNR
jgi:hypothetical protein